MRGAPARGRSSVATRPNGGYPIPPAHPADDDQDNLRASRGIIFGTLAGLIFWLAFLYFVFPA